MPVCCDEDTWVWKWCWRFTGPTLSCGHELWVVRERIRLQIQAVEMSFFLRVSELSFGDKDLCHLGGTQSRAASPLYQIEWLKVIQEEILAMTYRQDGLARLHFWADWLHVYFSGFILWSKWHNHSFNEATILKVYCMFIVDGHKHFAHANNCFPKCVCSITLYKKCLSLWVWHLYEFQPPLCSLVWSGEMIGSLFCLVWLHVTLVVCYPFLSVFSAFSFWPS